MAGNAPAGQAGSSPATGTAAVSPVVPKAAANEIATAPATASKDQPEVPAAAEPPKSEASTRTVTTIVAVTRAEPMADNDGKPLTKQVTRNGVTMTIPATKNVVHTAGEVITVSKGDADEMIAAGYARLTDPTLD